MAGKRQLQKGPVHSSVTCKGSLTASQGRNLHELRCSCCCLLHVTGRACHRCAAAVLQYRGVHGQGQVHNALSCTLCCSIITLTEDTRNYRFYHFTLTGMALSVYVFAAPWLSFTPQVTSQARRH